MQTQRKEPVSFYSPPALLNTVAWVRLQWMQKLGVGWVEERNPTPSTQHQRQTFLSRQQYQNQPTQKSSP